MARSQFVDGGAYVGCRLLKGKGLMSLTTTLVKNLAPGSRRFRVRDESGLFLEVMPSGTKSWRLPYRIAGVTETVTLGRWPRMTPAAARQKAGELLAGLEAHVPLRPKEALRRERVARWAGHKVTVEMFAKRWLEEVARPARKDPAEVEQTVMREVLPALGGRPVQEVTGAEVQAVIFGKRDAGYPAAAIVLRHLLKRFFDYAQVCGLITWNPVDQTPRKFVGHLQSRDRWLSRDELRIVLPQLRGGFGRGALDPRMGMAIRLLLLTLTRKSELRLARQEHVICEEERDMIPSAPPRWTWEIPAAVSKTGQAHIVHLSGQACGLFRSLKAMAGRAEVVLPSKESLARPIGPAELNKAIYAHDWGVAEFTPHDLRRTASTHLNEMGYAPDVIEAALNHTQKGVRGVYNRAKYAAERRKMLQDWADELDRIEGV